MNRIFRDQLAPNRYFRDFFQNLKQIYEINIFYSCVYLQWLVFRLSPGFDVRQLSYSNIIFFSLYVQVIALLLVFSLVTQVTWVQSLTIALRDFYHLFSCYLILTRSQTFCFGCNFFRLRFIWIWKQTPSPSSPVVVRSDGATSGNEDIGKRRWRIFLTYTLVYK